MNVLDNIVDSAIDFPVVSRYGEVLPDGQFGHRSRMGWNSSSGAAAV